MSTHPESPETTGGTDAEATDGRPTGGTRAVDAAATTPRRAVGGAGSSRRVLTTALAARVDQLAAERELLDDRVAELEAEVAAERRRRQQVIDRYEPLVAARSGEGPSREPSASGSPRWRPLVAVASRLKGLIPGAGRSR
jgi:hypothetical protein